MSKWSLMLATIVLAGCGSSAPVLTESLVPATGSVRIAGRPAEGVRLLFTPTGTTTGTVKPLYADDPLREVVFPWLVVRLASDTGEDSTATAADGTTLDRRA